MITDVKFETPLDSRREIEAVKRDGENVEAVLLADYSITFMWRGERWRLTVPQGFDYAPSVPKYLRWTVPYSGALQEASVVHDYAYYTRCFDGMGGGQKEADELLLAAMKAGGSGWIGRTRTYRTLRAFGRFSYAKHTYQPGNGPERVNKGVHDA